MPERWCGGCGQRAPDPGDYSPYAALLSLGREIADYDGRVWSTVRALYLEPGRLARDHFEGRRDRWVSPTRVFVWVNVLCWFVFPYLRIQGFVLKDALTGAIFRAWWPQAMAWRARWSEISESELVRRIDAIGAAEDSVAVLCMVPLFTLGPTLLLAGRRWRYGHHLVFSIHFYCIHLVVLLLVWGVGLGPSYRWLIAHPELSWTAPTAAALLPEWSQHLIVAPFLVPYLFSALRRAYGLDTREAAWRSVALALWAATMSRAFVDIAFALVLLLA